MRWPACELPKVSPLQIPSFPLLHIISLVPPFSHSQSSLSGSSYPLLPSLSVFCLSLCPSISHLIFLFLYLIKLSETDTIKALQNKYQTVLNIPAIQWLYWSEETYKIKDEWLKMIKYVPNQMLSNKWGKYICIKTWISRTSQEKDLIFVHINKSLRDHLNAQQDLCYADCLVVTLLTLKCSKLLRCVCLHVCEAAPICRGVSGKFFYQMWKCLWILIGFLYLELLIKSTWV